MNFVEISEEGTKLQQPNQTLIHHSQNLNSYSTLFINNTGYKVGLKKYKVSLMIYKS